MLTTVLVVLACLTVQATPVRAESAREYYEELRDANGFNDLATLACFPSDDKDKTLFMVVAFSRDFASALRARQKPVSNEFAELEKPGAKEFLFTWAYSHGVLVAPEPQMLDLVSKDRTLWESSGPLPDSKATVTLRITLSLAGRYKRDVLYNSGGEAWKARSVGATYGACESIWDRPKAK